MSERCSGSRSPTRSSGRWASGSSSPARQRRGRRCVLGRRGEPREPRGAAPGLALGATVTVGARDVPRVTVPGLLLFSGTLSYSFATQEGQLSVVSVLGSLFPIFTVGLAYVVLRERVGSAQAAGVAATLAGVVLISAQVT